MPVIDEALSSSTELDERIRRGKSERNYNFHAFTTSTSSSSAVNGSYKMTLKKSPYYENMRSNNF